MLMDLPLTLKIKGKDYEIGSLTVKDKVDKQLYIAANPDINPIIVDYAVLIKNPDMDLDAKIKVIRFADKSVFKIKDIDDRLLIKTSPVIKKCNKCGNPTKLHIGLDEVRGFPSFDYRNLIEVQGAWIKAMGTPISKRMFYKDVVNILNLERK